MTWRPAWLCPCGNVRTTLNGGVCPKCGGATARKGKAEVVHGELPPYRERTLFWLPMDHRPAKG